MTHSLYTIEYEDGEVIPDLSFEESNALFDEQYKTGRRCTCYPTNKEYKSP